MNKFTTLIAVAMLALSAPAVAGSWVCGEGCDLATFKGLKWTPGTKCAVPVPPAINTKNAKSYNESANAVNEYINQSNGYQTCLNEEVNADFTALQENVNGAAKSTFEAAQTDIKTKVDALSKELDEGLKKLNKK